MVARNRLWAPHDKPLPDRHLQVYRRAARDLRDQPIERGLRDGRTGALVPGVTQGRVARAARSLWLHRFFARLRRQDGLGVAGRPSARPEDAPHEPGRGPVLRYAGPAEPGRGLSGLKRLAFLPVPSGRALPQPDAGRTGLDRLRVRGADLQERSQALLDVFVVHFGRGPGLPARVRGDSARGRVGGRSGAAALLCVLLRGALGASSALLLRSLPIPAGGQCHHPTLELRYRLSGELSMPATERGLGESLNFSGVLVYASCAGIR